MFINEELSTECIKSFKSISLLGELFGPFEKGKKYRLKLFSAIPFIENNILRISLDEKCDSIDVQRFAIDERDDQRLVLREDKYFLNKIKEFKIFMEMEIYNKNKPPIDLDRYNSYLSNIVDSRLSKLLRLAKAELSLDDERRLTNSEKLLSKYLFKCIKIWRGFFLAS
ncbi:MAG: hypothetical protein ACFFA6_06055 [Promethearchaeota archaeon]